jgi:hypothetical protein
VAGAKGETGPTGPKGETGVAGAKGETGATGPPGPVSTHVESAQVTSKGISGTENQELNVTCKTGVVTGGGVRASPSSALQTVSIKATEPLGSPPTGWHGEAEQVSGVAVKWTLFVEVVCAP